MDPFNPEQAFKDLGSELANLRTELETAKKDPKASPDDIKSLKGEIDTVKKAKLIAETGSWVEDVVVEEDPTAVLEELKNLPVAEPKRRPAPAPNVPSNVPNLDDLAATFGAPAGPVVGQGEVDAAIKTAETTPEPAPPAVSDPVEAAFQVNKGDKSGRRK